MDYLNDAQVSDLVLRLKSLTDRGRIVWEKDPQSEFRFVVRTPKFGYGVRSKDEDDFHPYVLEVHTLEPDRARKLQEFSSAAFPAEAQDAVALLYLMAKRRALGVDELARDIFNDLDRLEP